MNDDNIWQEFTKNIKPLKQTDNQYFKATPKSKPAINLVHSSSPLTDGMYEKIVSAKEPLFFAQPGLQIKTIHQLKTGQIPIKNDIDLHGLTVEQSRQRLFDFLNGAYHFGERCVLVIHGKGKAVLKSKVNHWLCQLDFVLAFCSAQNRHGGTGSVYVLLKRKQS